LIFPRKVPERKAQIPSKLPSELGSLLQNKKARDYNSLIWKHDEASVFRLSIYDASSPKREEEAQ